MIGNTVAYLVNTMIGGFKSMLSKGIQKANKRVLEIELDNYTKGERVNYNLCSSMEIIESSKRVRAIEYSLEKLDQGLISRSDLINIIGYVLGYRV